MSKKNPPGDYRVSVLSPEHSDRICTHCGEAALIFNAHCFAEAGRPVMTGCKECVIVRAGGEDAIWVKTTWRGLRKLWTANRRGAPPASLAKARAVRQQRAYSSCSAAPLPQDGL